MKFLGFVFFVFSFAQPVGAFGFGDFEAEDFFLGHTKYKSSKPEKKERKSFFDEEGDEERDTASEKKSLQEFAIAQTDPISVGLLSEYESNRFVNYLAGNSIEVGVEYPINFGIHFKSRMNGDFYGRFGIGFVTEFFLGGFSKIAPNLGYLNQQEADLISDVFKNSFYTDLRLGWSPYYEKHAGGPYLELGASGMFFGRGETSGFTLGKAIGIGDESQSSYSVKSNIYTANFHVGYQIPIEKHINVHVEAGVLKIVNADLMPKEAPGVRALPPENHEVFKKFLLKKGWIFPTASAWFAVAF